MATAAKPQTGIGEIERAALSRVPAVVSETSSSYALRPSCWHDVTVEQWADYRWQMQNRIFTAEALSRLMPLTDDEVRGIEAFAKTFSLCVSPHYASLMLRGGAVSEPLRRQCVPTTAELQTYDMLMDDPLGEARHHYCACATRRYPDRALIYTTHACAMRCRHCTRRTKVGRLEEPTLDMLLASVDAVCAESNIRDVLLSGGDALSLPNSWLKALLERLRACPHIDVIRICTRMPCTLPQRLNDPELLEILERFAPLYVNTQFNHPDEVSVESAQAFKHLRAAGCILGNQSVLLKGVNTEPESHEALGRWLLRNGCRPYYLFLCDVAQGTYHFRTSIADGLAIMTHLRGRLSGLGIPHFVVDLPDGMGKVELAPNRMTVSRDDPQDVVFNNWFGAAVAYRDEN